MAFGLDLGENVLDFSIGTDDERRARDAHDFLAVHVFFLNYAKLFGDFFVGIGKQGKGKMEFVLKFFLRFGGVGRDAKQHGAGFLNLFISITEGTGLHGASGSVGAGVEIENHDFAAKAF